jgi:glycosyltransferase involved in cell wall biosynthesis
MPCLNEEETLGICIQKARRSIDAHSLHAEILIADNGSTDNSISIATKLGARVVHAEEKGYGNALRYGISNAKGTYVIMADSDDSYDFSDILPFVVKLREGYDLVVGNRFLGGIQKNAMPFLHRYLGNPVLSFIGKLFFNIQIGDFHCGFRAFHRQSMIDIDLFTPGMEFASEMIVKSSLNNLRISEVSVTLSPDGRSRPPHLQTWQDGWRHLRFLLLYSPKWLFLYPGLLLMMAGIFIFCVLLPRPFSIGDVTFDIHTMLYAASSVLIGFQMATLYCFSRIISIRDGIRRETRWMRSFNKYFSLEKGLILGAAVLLSGCFLSVYSVRLWTDTSFGDLQPSRMLRIIIPSTTFLMLGIQIVFNSFFASMLNLNPLRRVSS